MNQPTTDGVRQRCGGGVGTTDNEQVEWLAVEFGVCPIGAGSPRSADRVWRSLLVVTAQRVKSTLQPSDAGIDPVKAEAHFDRVLELGLGTR